MAGDPFFDKIRLRWQEDAVGTNAGASATHAAVAGRKHVLTGFQASGDAACVVTVESPSATVLYTKRFAAAFNVSETFAPGTIVGPTNSALIVKISASTSNCEVNSQGYEISG